METLSEVITRLRKELSTARATRDRILKTSQGGGFGGISFSFVAFEQVNAHIARLEAQLYRAEAIAAGSDVQPDVRLAWISSL